MWNKVSVAPLRHWHALAQPIRHASNTNIRTVTLIPGDGIGPEIAVSVQRYETHGQNNSKAMVIQRNFQVVQVDINKQTATDLILTNCHILPTGKYNLSSICKCNKLTTFFLNALRA